MIRILLCVGVMLWFPLLALEQAVVDRVLRYVNADVITLYDVQQRAIDQLRAHQRDNPDAVLNRATESRMINQAIRELTEEALLLQEAERLGVTIDHEHISRRIREQSADIAQDQRLEQQALLRDHLRRRETITAVLRYYEQRYPDISPGQMHEIYQQRRHVRPERIRPWRISLRVPGATGDDEASLNALRAAFVTATRLADPIFTEVDFDAVRERYIDVPDTAGRIALLRRVLEPLAHPATVSQNPAVQALGAEITAALAAMDAEHAEDDLHGLLEEIRQDVQQQQAPTDRLSLFVGRAEALAGRDDVALRDGRAIDLGFMEASALPGAFAEAVVDLEAGDLSPVFRSGEHLHLMLVSAREVSRERAFSEISAEMRPRLEQVRQDVIRQRVVARLVRRATIRDID